MKLKLLKSDTVELLNDDINKFLNTIDTQAIDVKISVNILHDYFTEQTPIRICNTWYEYIAIIIYED